MTASPRLPDAAPDPVLRAATLAWQDEVLRLDAVDPVTTELVRLRGASHHACDT